ncbi:esterase-like activity of phytase family protein [Agromyces larvae]|uniref:Esterase-like activity of phytase family protein n=1 Tax=Agromyces larvae TaxID=2929802 RepID=A0ABY4BV09_9MICO|nr:esterase-like activity of phytase family protein [Agromyces larvae]UOE42990.1 esterase-like activity of phytase family protein [Agromyces larvae]
MSRPLSIAALAVASIIAAGAAGAAAAPALAADGEPEASVAPFARTATYPVFQNVPDGVDPAEATVAEISTITDDGTVVYTDALGKRIGFVDVTDPSNPVGAGTVELAELGHADDQPTSVAAYGDFVLVVIDETGGEFTAPKGRLDVLRASDRTVVRSIDLGGQPDSIAISKDGAYAAIAIENQRDEELAPEGGDEGDLPQLPGGFVQVLGLGGDGSDPADPATWTLDAVSFLNDDGTPIDVIAAAGLDTPEDPEPEYVAINSRNELAVTLQENNGIAIIDLATREVTRAFSAGSVAVSGIDVKKDARIDLTGSIPATPREPDAIAWIGDDRLATANEGDWKGGTRGWTVFDAADGDVVWDAGNTFERLAVQHGLANNDRAAKKGSEPEGLAVAEFDGTPYAFVASERSNFIAVYDVSDPAAPAFVQVLFSTNGPEGILPVPGRDLLVVSSETDDSSVNVRASVNVYVFGEAPAGTIAQPSIVSGVDASSADGAPIGWQALGALAGNPTDATHVWAASDVAVAPSTVYSIDVSRTPAVVDRAIRISDEQGASVALDIEGLAVDGDGGFWLALEGATGAANQLVHTDGLGLIDRRVDLPADVTAHIGKWGLEGVTVTGSGADAQLWVAIQRPLWTDPANAAAGTVDGDDVTRIGRYDLAGGEWSWYGYRLEHTSVAGDWLGLSEITAIDDDTFALIERDKLNGPAAAVKRVTTVDLPAGAGATDASLAAGGTLPILEKRTAIDVLPALRATHGWTQEKLEGFAIAADGQLYAVTDNDGLADATGETVFLRLGDADAVFGGGTGEEPGGEEPGGEEPGQPDGPSITLGASTVVAGGTVVVSGTGFEPGASVRFELRSEPVALGAATAAADGTLSFTATIPAATPAGAHTLVAILPDGTEVSAALTVTAAAAPVGSATGASGDLASTGVEFGWALGLAGLVLAAGGAAAVVGTRRRRQAA